MESVGYNMAKECRCMRTFKSWMYVGPIPHRSGRENHLWECQICGRKHVTADKQKPSEAQANRVLK